MLEKEPSEQTLRSHPIQGVARRLSALAKVLALLILLGLATVVLPRSHVFRPLAPGADVLAVSGIVKAAPHATPLARTTVYSDRDLEMTDENGAFRIVSGRGSLLRVEAPGYQPAQSRIQDETPVILLLFPEPRD